MPLPLLFWVIGGIIAGAAIIAICWDDIQNWFFDNTVHADDYGEMIRERQAKGKVRVISGVFDTNDNLISKKEWIGEPDEEVDEIFGPYDHIRLTL